MDISKAKSTIEAILFASGEPYEISKLAGVIEIDEKTVINLVKENKRFMCGKSFN